MTRPSLCLPMLFVLACPCLAQQPGLKLTTSRPGNLYDYLAPVTVSVSATGLTAPEWTLIDFDRKMVASGKVSLTDGKGTISLGLLPRGYYELTCTEGPTTARLPLGVIKDHSATPPRDTLDLRSGDPKRFPFSDMDWASFSAADANRKLDLDKIVSLRLGLNTTKDKVWLEVRNVRLIKF